MYRYGIWIQEHNPYWAWRLREVVAEGHNLLGAGTDIICFPLDHAILGGRTFVAESQMQRALASLPPVSDVKADLVRAAARESAMARGLEVSDRSDVQSLFSGQYLVLAGNPLSFCTEKIQVAANPMPGWIRAMAVGGRWHYACIQPQQRRARLAQEKAAANSQAGVVADTLDKNAGGELRPAQTARLEAHGIDPKPRKKFANHLKEFAPRRIRHRR